MKILLLALLAASIALAQSFPPASGGGGSGASATYQLTDVATSKTTGTLLTTASGCGSTTYCNVSFNGVTKQVVASGTTSPVGTPTITVRGWIDSAGAFNVAAPTGASQISCTGCTIQTATSFPDGVFRLFAWPMVSGVWNTFDPSYDMRAAYSVVVPPLPGAGCSVSTVAGVSTISCASAPILYSLNALITYASGAYTMAPVSMTGCAGVVCSCLATVTPKASNTGTTAQALRITYTDALTNDASIVLYGASGAGVPMHDAFVVNSKAATTPTVDIGIGGTVAGDKFGVVVICQ